MLQKIANTVRGLAADGVEAANSGHPGMPLGCAEIGAVLYGDIMKYDPLAPEWIDRDRFILSAGHGSMFLYSFLHLAGFDLSLEDLKNFRQLDSKTPGHPEYGHTEGVETTTGPLGQGFTNAVGMALAERILAEKYNTPEHKIIDHYTYTILGDGCMMEGITAEAGSLAGHLGLGKMIAIYDDNDISIAGSTELAFTESVGDRFKAYNWHVIENVDGHDLNAVKEAIEEAKSVTDKPSLIMAKTKIAFGAPTKEGTSDAHGAPLGEEEIKGLKEKIGLPPTEKFYIDSEVKQFFAERRNELKQKRIDWEDTFTQWSKDNPQLRNEWDQAFALALPSDIEETIFNIEIDTPIATRKAAGTTLTEIADKISYLIGGSADLAPSNKTYLDKYGEIQNGQYDGRNLRFGVREHAMGAIANGISLHGGLRPFVATFLVFSDYMKPAIRLGAMMKQPVIYVFTHDSIYVGEDGPTHQPVEHIESLRLIPGLKVLRPGDAEETKAAWYQALTRTEGPTALILTRQSLPQLEKVEGLTNFNKGGYIIKEEISAEPDVVLLGSGSEVSLAVKVAEKLEEKNKTTRVVSIPDRKEFTTDKNYLEKVLGSQSALRVILEAGIGQGWYQLVGDKYHIVSIEEFGASGPGEEVALKYGFDVDKITTDILSKLS